MVDVSSGRRMAAAASAADPWAQFADAPPAGASPAAADPWASFADAPDPGGFMAPAPPPGVVIHGGDGRDYVGDQPQISAARPAVVQGIVDDAKARVQDRLQATVDAALQRRAVLGDGAGAGGRGLMPAFQGVSLGAGDEAVSALGGVAAAAQGGSFRDTFDVNQEVQRQELARERAEHPIRAAATEFAGGMLPAATGAKLASAGTRMMGGGMRAAMVANGVVGAGMGGAHGFAATDGSIADRAEAAERGAQWGGGLGAVSPLIAAGAGSVARYGAQKAQDLLYGLQHGAEVPAAVADPFLRSLQSQGSTVDDMMARVRDLGPGAVPADTGPALQAKAVQYATRDMPSSPGMVQRLTDRADEFGPRMNAAVDAAAGPDVNAPAMMRQLRDTTARNGAANYGRAFSNPSAVDVSPVLQQIDSQIAPGSGMVGSGVRDDPITAALRQARSYIAGGGHQAVNIETLHRAQDVIDDMASSALRSGDNSKARALWQTRSALLRQMDGANPDYAVARQGYASDKAIENAFENGRSVFASRVDGQVFDPDLLEARLSSMAQPEQDAFKLGVRKALTDTMGQARTDAAGVRTKLANENGYAVGKLRQVIGNDQTDGLLRELDHQAAMQATNNLAINGSKTAIATAANDAIPQARLVGGGTGAAFGTAAGAYLGEKAGAALGYPVVGTLAGPAVGYSINRAAGAINAGREAAAAAARQGEAELLTSTPTQRMARALLAREGVGPAVEGAGARAQQIARILLTREAQDGSAVPDAVLARTRLALARALAGQ